MNEQTKPIVVMMENKTNLSKGVLAGLAVLRSVFYTGIIGICFLKTAMDFEKTLKEQKANQ